MEEKPEGEGEVLPKMSDDDSDEGLSKNE